MLGGRALSSGFVRSYARTCRPFQSGSRRVNSFSNVADRQHAQQIQHRISAIQQAEAVTAPPGLLTVPWDDTPEQQQACRPMLDKSSLCFAESCLAESCSAQPTTSRIAAGSSSGQAATSRKQLWATGHRDHTVVPA